MRGGIKVYRGSAAAARNYVEADRSRADDYYLAEGSGLAELLLATADGRVVAHPPMNGDTYEAWVAGYDVSTGEAKGRLRTDDAAVRFLEVVVNGPKTWSLAAAVDPVIAETHEQAQDRAVEQIVAYLAEHTTTRIGARGRQVQVPVEQLQAAVVRHWTSRAGDPHWHLHLQVNARVWAAGKWRGLHTVGMRDMLGAINGIGHAAVMCDPDFRAAVASQGYHLDADGEVRELLSYAGRFSARSAQIARITDRLEAQWRTEHPGQEPGPTLRQRWDRRAWAEHRPDKVQPVDGPAIVADWRRELAEEGFMPPAPSPAMTSPLASPPQDVDACVETVLARLALDRSAWNGSDIRGEVERWMGQTGAILEPDARCQAASALTTHVLQQCVPLLSRSDVPGHVRHLTSPHVLAVEADLTTRLSARAADHYWLPTLDHNAHSELDPTQRRIVRAMAGPSQLLVIEGAAGAGKTTTLAAARDELARHGRSLVVVTPTLKAAEVAARQVGTAAFSASRLVHEHGFRWDDDGRWTRTATAPQAHRTTRLVPGDVLVVDEAGMVDQDLLLALTQVADQNQVQLVLMGDPHQLSAVGRGGGLQLAARLAHPDDCLTLDRVHRFTDPAYAELSLSMRTGRDSARVFDTLREGGEIVLHASEVERTAALVQQAADDILASASHGLVLAETREQVADLNAGVRDRLVAAGYVDDTAVTTTDAGQRIGTGDRITTRRNDRHLQVANRDTWTVQAIGEDGELRVSQGRRGRVLPARYVRRHVELAYAGTVHAAQGDTVDCALALVDPSTTGAAAYVAMTRGRHRNTAHLVAESLEQARDLWVDVFSHDRADLGPAAAADAAAEAVEVYGPMVRAALRLTRDLEGSELETHTPRGRPRGVDR